MQPRAAHPADAAMLARIHIAAWQETYAGLLPDNEIARASNPERRLAQWTGAIARIDTRIAVIDDLGFAQMGRQRDPGLAALGYTEELWAIYLRRAAQGRGHGAALLRFVLGADPLPFTTLVVAGNRVASSFYKRQGGRLLATRDEAVGLSPIREDVYVWDDPLRLVRP